MGKAASQQMLASVFKALGHPTRLGLALMLQDGERCVCELVEELGGGQQSNISQHLAVLRGAGLLASRKEGLSVYYRLRHPEVLELVRSAERMLLRDLEHARDSLAVRQ